MRELPSAAVGSIRPDPGSILTDRAALAALIDAGVTLERIAAQEGCSASTVRRQARRLGLPPLKPGRPPIPPQVDRDTLEMKAWTADELRTFTRATNTHRWAGVWALMATTGMRRGEKCGSR